LFIPSYFDYILFIVYNKKRTSHPAIQAANHPGSRPPRHPAFQAASHPTNRLSMRTNKQITNQPTIRDWDGFDVFPIQSIIIY